MIVLFSKVQANVCARMDFLLNLIALARLVTVTA